MRTPPPTIIRQTIVRMLLSVTVVALLAVMLAPSAHGQTEAPRNLVTEGSGDRTPMRTTSAEGPVNGHGTRVYCAASHLAYDDPVVHPGRPGAAHLHTFWGNTETDATSTGQSLLGSGNSSCEGGINNRSAYWAPTVFDALDQAVIPEEIFVYYKSFGGPNFDRTTIQPVPNGLEMLATSDVEGSWVTDFRVQSLGRQLKLSIWFPVCIAVDASGSPILSSADNTSHLSYGSPGDGDGSDCPSSHPYRIPQVSYHLLYDVDPASGWYLSSDESAATQGESLHADYIAAWDAESMDRLTECNVLARQHCEFGDFDGHRQQLPERFTAPNGEVLYTSSVELRPSADRTPFGAALTKMYMPHGADTDGTDTGTDADSTIQFTMKWAPFGSVDGFVIFETGPEAGQRQWVPAECRAALTAAGAAGLEFVDYWAEVGDLPVVTNWRTCPELLALVP